MGNSPLSYAGTRIVATDGPAEGVAADVVPFQSAAPHRPWWTRDDPFWSGLLHPSAPSFAKQRHAIPVPVSEGGGYASPHDDVRPITRRDRAWETLLNSSVVHAVLAVLCNMFHASTWQLAAWTGRSTGALSPVLSQLYEYGVLARAKYVMDWQIPGSTVNFHALHPGYPLRRWFRDRAEMDATTGQRVVWGLLGENLFTSRFGSAGNMWVSHNLLVLEAVLRILEVQPRFVSVRGGRPSTTPRRLTGQANAPTYVWPDAVLRRDDGLRVAIELVAADNEGHMTSKMRKWRSWFLDTPWDKTGTVVVFLNAHMRDHGRAMSTLRRVRRRVLSDKGRPYWEMLHERRLKQARQQIHLASWEDWFPAHHEISVLGRDVVTVASLKERGLVPVALADPVKVPYRGAVYPGPTGSLLTPPWAGPGRRTVGQ